MEAPPQNNNNNNNNGNNNSQNPMNNSARPQNSNDNNQINNSNQNSNKSKKKKNQEDDNDEEKNDDENDDENNIDGSSGIMKNIYNRNFTIHLPPQSQPFLFESERMVCSYAKNHDLDPNSLFNSLTRSFSSSKSKTINQSGKGAFVNQISNFTRFFSVLFWVLF